MKKIRTSLLIFNTPISPHEIPLLRGVAIKATKGETLLCHNHEGERLRYAYPLVQYKRVKGRAAMVFVGDETAVTEDYFRNHVLEVDLGSRRARLELLHAETDVTEVGVEENSLAYSLRQYLPFNQKNYEEYQRSDSLAERIAILERCLTGNILSFAKGVEVHLDKRVEVRLNDISRPSVYRYKGVKMVGFDMELKTNVSLPEYIGLGKGTSLGFGTVSRQKISIE